MDRFSKMHLSDRGPQFMSRLWKELLGKLNITVSLMSGYHHQANGQVERINQELRYQPALYPWNAPTSDQPAVEDWYCRSERVWEEAHQNLRKAITHYKRKADMRRGETPRYELGHQVQVSTKDGWAGPLGKLHAKYEGPYTILEQVNDVTYRVGLPGNSKASRAFHVSALELVVESPLAVEGCPLGPPPLDIEGGSAYRVHTLLDLCQSGKQLQYLVDWEGYSPEERSWVPASQVLNTNLTASFNREDLGKPVPR
ncbi:hypothetical protein P4O66_008115 [Electrophorus voltai]|uniref:Integrase catalytic domain-containing protein n=1 Tax=Electrophorus voltai TaxID=2609070 RepID=A0AAD9E0C4_9TELE|nr:hypothetical protein P4O66_008115 [Electrophorus voltai]